MVMLDDDGDSRRARDIWGQETERIPIWLDCDTGHDVSAAVCAKVRKKLKSDRQDAFAILLCATCPRLKLLGISTVHGNAGLADTTNNTLSILEAIGCRDVPVYAGADKPFCREPAHAEAIHGVSGLDGTTVLPDPVARAQQHPQGTITAMYDALAAYPGTGYLASTGSLTNIGLLFAAHPDLAASIAGLSIMGGAVGGFFTNAPMGRVTDHIKLEGTVYDHFPAGLPEAKDMSVAEIAQRFKELGLLDTTGSIDDSMLQRLLEQARTSFGNWTPYAEFNIYCDPEAASSIFSNPILAPKTTLIPLDLTHQVLATQEILNLLLHGRPCITTPDASVAQSPPNNSSSSSITRHLFHEILTFFASTYAAEFGMTAGPPLHDPLAVAAILAPALFDDRRGERFAVSVVRDGEDAAATGVSGAGPKQRRKGAVAGECGRTMVRLLDEGEAGVRIPRGVQTGVFWHLLNIALEMVDARQ